MVKIALIGEYLPDFEPHQATNAAIEHSCRHLHVDVAAEWVSTADVDDSLFDRFHGIWIAPGSPNKSLDNTLWTIRMAREEGVPCLATCGGFQHMIVEYARNVLGFRDAQHAEYDPDAPVLFVSRLERSLAGRSMELRFVPGSRLARIYGTQSATERFYCNFGVNPAFVDVLKGGPLPITASDQEGEVRAIEDPEHPFFIGTLFVPQARSTPENPHPLVTEFVRVVAGRSM